MTARPKSRGARSGQIVLILVFMLAGLVALFMLETDIFLALRDKNRLQNAGDAAALAAARWQGVTLNLIGELNLLHLAAACETNRPACEGIAAIQERLAVAGPMVGFWAANEAAKRNGAPVDEGMTSIVEYAMRTAEGHASPTWPEKGTDYAAMLRTIVAGGVAAGADNARLLPVATVDGGHPLYDKVFYAAAKVGDWRTICLHVFGGNHAKAASTLLSWPGWGEIPPASVSNDFVNSEFFSVGVRRGALWLDAQDGAVAEALVEAAADAGLDDVVTARAMADSPLLADVSLPWYFYDGTWRAWSEVDRQGEACFPLMGSVKACYDVLGATAACRVRAPLPVLSETSVTNMFAWTAAAKPFGQDRNRRVTDIVPGIPLVLPSFSFVRLIPLGGVGESNLGAADDEWLRHVREHVPNGMRVPSCRYCRILLSWESPGFTRAGGECLMSHAHDEMCVPGGVGPGPGGGARHAH